MISEIPQGLHRASKSSNVPQSSRRVTLAATVVLAAAIAWLYSDVVPALVRQWAADDNYSHGFFIVPLAAYFAWERRRAFAAAPLRPSLLGLVVVAGSMLMLVAGLLGAELFVSRVSIIGALGGALLFLFGWQHLRVMLF